MRNHRVHVCDEWRRESRLFGGCPPGATARRREYLFQILSGRQLESPFRKNSALGSVPDMKRRPEIFIQEMREPQLIGLIQCALSTKAGRHELGNVAVGC